MKTNLALWRSASLCLDFIALTRRYVSPDLTEALVFAAALNANVMHLDADAAASRRWARFDLGFPTAPRRPIRTARLADSLGIPRQTISNKVAGLTRSGWAISEADGVTIRSEPFLSEAGLTSLNEYLARSQTFIAAAAGDGLAGLARGERLVDPLTPVAWLVIRLITNHALQTIYATRQAFGAGSAASDFIMLNLIVETWEFQGEPPPLSDSALAKKIGLPRETTRRWLIDLSSRGLVVRDGAGARVAPALMTSSAMAPARTGAEIGLRRMVRRLRDLEALTT